MSEDTSGTAAPERTVLTSRREYLEAFDALLALAHRELRVFDPDLAQLGLNTAARIEALVTFLRRSPSSHFYVVVHDDDHLVRHCPRFAEVVALFGTNIDIRRTDGDAARAQDCFMIVDTDHCVRRPVAAQPRGVMIRNDPNETALMRERFDQIWENSTPAAPATTLGV